MNEKPLCFSCLFLEERPEVGVNNRLIYCRKKDKILRPKSSCEFYILATEENRNELQSQLYGVFFEDEFEGE
ncbi:MAG: hypothetical protein QW083_03095 [Methanomassiliicoccales archaeon]